MGVHPVVRPEGGSKIIGVSGLAGMGESLFPKILSHLSLRNGGSYGESAQPLES